MNTTEHASPEPTPGAPEGSIKETLEAIIIAFVLAFVFRAFVVEAFVIPTGSMAPTLLGQHVSLTDPRTGYRFKVGPWTNGDNNVPNGKQFRRQMSSPMGAGAFEVPDRRVEAGDRILVLKYLYGVSEPRRWDVVVFKNPENPTINYIKRLVGLPNENLRIIRGNVYTQPNDGDAAPWRVQVKPAAVQRAVWQPIYHSQYVPIRPEQVDWTSPWQSGDGSGAVTQLHHGRAFRVEGAASLDFNYQQLGDRFATDFYPYNDTYAMRNPFGGGRGMPSHTVEDLRLAVSVTPQDDGVGVTLRQLGQLIEIEAAVNAAGDASLRVRLTGAEVDFTQVAARSGAVAWKADRTSRLELWHADHRVSLWVDGRRVLAYDAPVVSPGQSTPDGPVFASLERLLSEQDRGYPRTPPAVSIATQGAARLSDLELDRDLYYTQGQSPQFGTRDAAPIGPDQFYCLGDNSPQSKDSRMWTMVHPSLERHLPDQPIGLVPRRLMIGRAFFVYFPAPLSHGATNHAFIPNFGELRFIH